MLKIRREQAVFTLSPWNNPVAHASSGDTIIFETYDCFSNELTQEDQDYPSSGWDRVNPATGPLYVEGAKPGDILRVEILDIVLDSQGVMWVGPGSGALGHVLTEQRTKIIPVVDGKAMFNDRLALEVNPMIGVIGTAPGDEEIPTGTPGAHGGNMDCKRIGKGSAVFLPVNVPGALLAMGDVHALMGDGEVIVCGMEIAAQITVKVDVLKGLALPLPMVVAGSHVMTIASEITLDQAAVTASEMMLQFIQQALNMDLQEAGMLLSIMGDLHICQIVDPLMTARMEFPLWILEAYGYRIN
ncbi:MAG TPA: acetamidase [Firmicutes bacterium]|nr:acetamidase [Bacillota bacterium]